MVIGSYLTGVASGLTVEAIKALGIRWKGDATPFKDKPHWRLGQRPSIGRTVLGRAELTDLVATTLGNRRAVAIVRGMGGVGKTTLARHYVESYGARYHGVLWVQAEDESTLINDLILLAAAVDVPGIDRIADAKARAQACLDAVSASDEDWLIVFDNAPDESALIRWPIEGKRVRVLATSRATDWSPVYSRITADVLPTAKADEAGPKLLMAEAETSDDPEGARAVAEALGGLPLALVAAGRLISHMGGGFARYLDAYQNVLTTEVHSYHVPDGLERSVIGAVKLSYDALDDDARAVLDLFAWFAPEGLEASLLADVPGQAFVGRALGKHIAHGKHIGTTPGICGDSNRIESALRVLCHRSLLARYGTTFSLHRMTSAAVRALQEVDGRRDETAEWAAVILHLLFPPHTDQSSDWPKCARLTPHVLSLQQHWITRNKARVISDAAALLLIKTSDYLRLGADKETSLLLAESVRDSLPADLSDSDPLYMLLMTALGSSYIECEQWQDSLGAHEILIRIHTTVDHGPRELATSYNNYASALWSVGVALRDNSLLVRAKEANHRALSIRVEEFGCRSKEVANSRANLASFLFQEKKYVLALKNSKQALAIMRRVLPPGDDRTVDSLKVTGALYVNLGNSKFGLPLLREALALFSEIYDDDANINVMDTAGWLVACHLVLARRDPLQTVAAWTIAQKYGLDWEECQRKAAQYPGPVD